MQTGQNKNSEPEIVKFKMHVRFQTLIGEFLEVLMTKRNDCSTNRVNIQVERQKQKNRPQENSIALEWRIGLYFY